MNKYIAPFFVVGLLAFTLPAKAQFVGLYFGPRYPHRYHRGHEGPPPPPFNPTISISVGYGFPNLDKYEMPGVYGLYQGNSTQMMGPLAASIDYRFERSLSIGLLVTHGTIDVPYYDYATNTKQFTGSLDNWAVMLNLINYLPVNSYNETVLPYMRLAVGVNIWNQSYTDPSGNPVNIQNIPDDLAYQLSLGAKFKLSDHTAFFAEAGWGKYILEGGLSFKF
jgi:hypothetical protein